ncbi:MAG: hypothetical protein WC390_07425 [Sulfurimonas sp.]|jgi:hypothetical protein
MKTTGIYSKTEDEFDINDRIIEETRQIKKKIEELIKELGKKDSKIVIKTLIGTLLENI